MSIAFLVNGVVDLVDHCTVAFADALYEAEVQLEGSVRNGAHGFAESID